MPGDFGRCKNNEIKLRSGATSTIRHSTFVNSQFQSSSFVNCHSSFLKFTGFQLMAKKFNLLFYRAVLLDSELDTIDGMQRSGMTAVK